MELYNEIYGTPIFDVYDDDEESILYVSNDADDNSAILGFDYFAKNIQLIDSRIAGSAPIRPIQSHEPLIPTPKNFNKEETVPVKPPPLRDKFAQLNASSVFVEGISTTRQLPPLRHNAILREIRNYQSSTKLLICKLPFRRLVHDRGGQQLLHETLIRSFTSILEQHVGSVTPIPSFLPPMREPCCSRCFHESNKKLLEFGVCGFTHKNMNFGDKVLLDDAVLMNT